MAYKPAFHAYSAILDSLDKNIFRVRPCSGLKWGPFTTLKLAPVLNVALVHEKPRLKSCHTAT